MYRKDGLFQKLKKKLIKFKVKTKNIQSKYMCAAKIINEEINS